MGVIKLSEFIPLEQFLQQNSDYTKRQLIVARCNDFARKRTSRFKKVNGKFYIHRSFPNIYKDKILLCEELYFKVSEYFETDYALAKHFAPLMGEKSELLLDCLYKLKFWQREHKIHKTLRLIDEFNKFLKDKQCKQN